MQTLSDHILDIAQNSIRAQASRVEIDLQENATEDSLVITIKDNGCGMDEATVAKVTDPFFTSRTVRKVGLGIPLFKQNAEATGNSAFPTGTDHPWVILPEVSSFSYRQIPKLTLFTVIRRKKGNTHSILTK